MPPRPGPVIPAVPTTSTGPASTTCSPPARRAGVKRLVFVSLLDAAQHRDVPLMDIKACTEAWLDASDFDYTILRCVAFMQGLISQIAIPVLESQTVWVSGTPTPIAYMNTQDVARFAVAALDQP